jgi:hypothetical protein
MDDNEPSVDHSTFRNRFRLPQHEVASEFFPAVVVHAQAFVG